MTSSSSGRILRQWWLVSLLAVVLLMSGCDNPPDQTPAMLEVRVKDHRDAIDDFKSLQLEITALRLSPEPGLKSTEAGWVELEPTVREFDLTLYKNGDSLLIYQGEAEPQSFAAIDLRVGEAAGVLAKTDAPAKVQNNVRPIRATFATEPGLTVAVVLDLEVLDLSDHPGRGYELRVRGYELFADGELVEKVPPG